MFFKNILCSYLRVPYLSTMCLYDFIIGLYRLLIYLSADRLVSEPLSTKRSFLAYHPEFKLFIWHNRILFFLSDPTL